MKKLQNVIWRWNFSFVLIMTVAVIGIIAVSVYQLMLDDYARSKLMLLTRVAEQSEMISRSTYALATDIYRQQVYNLLKHSDEPERLEAEITKTTEEANHYFRRVGINLSVSIIMRNGFEYSSKFERKADFDAIKSNFWYIDNFGNDKHEFWVMRFAEDGKSSSGILSYARVVRNGKGGYEGIILVNSPEQAYYGLYSDIVDEYSKAYILDNKGSVISHSQKLLIGMNLVYMPAFTKEYAQKPYKVGYKGGKNVLTTIYQDKLTGWTYVLETDMSHIYKGYGRVFLTVGVIMAGIILIWSIGFYNLSEKISEPLRFFSNNLDRAANENFQPVQLKGEYQEVYDVSVIYNKMVHKIAALIKQVKREERIKRKNELTFLQMQINPHFLHNTLFSIKCLIELGKNDQAAKMMGLFMKMLAAPINANNEFVPLRSEAEYICNYIELMSYRYGNKIRLELLVDEGAEEFLVPRMIFQPIVENSIFYGFNNMDSGCVIDFFAYVTDDCLFVEIRDNGCGMSREELVSIYTRQKSKKLPFNNIGLKNIKERIRILYGPKSFLNLSSIEGEGTSAMVCLQRGEEKE